MKSHSTASHFGTEETPWTNFWNIIFENPQTLHFFFEKKTFLKKSHLVSLLLSFPLSLSLVFLRLSFSICSFGLSILQSFSFVFFVFLNRSTGASRGREREKQRKNTYGVRRWEGMGEREVQRAAEGVRGYDQKKHD